MFIKELKLVSFKNHSSFSAKFCVGINCMSGPNGAGKTNVLDAIHYLVTGKSYFSFSDKQSIEYGKTMATIKGKFEYNHELDDVLVSLRTEKKKTIKVNGQLCKKLSELVGRYTCVLVTPSDISMVWGGSEERRNFMDRTICQSSKSYLHALNEYNKLLENRNRALKNMAGSQHFDPLLLSVYEKQMTGPALEIHGQRKAFFEELDELFQTIYRHISDDRDHIEIYYESELETKSIDQLFVENMERDRILERTTSGVHKDEMACNLADNHPLKKVGSQGQIKSFVISLKLASMQWLKNKTGKTPILMLDDVFEKLDDKRLNNVLAWIAANYSGQIFITDAFKDRLKDSVEGFDLEKKFFNIDL